MSANIEVSVDAQAALDLLGRLRGAIAARETVHRVAAEAAGKLVRGWFLARNQDRSKHTTSNYWSHAAEATSAEADAQSGRVIVRHPGTAWHRYGGTIYAKPGKAMALPLRDEVYGVWPSERFPNRGDAFVWRSPKGQAFLAHRDGQALRILYLLLKSVSKPEDPTVLPSNEEIAAAAAAAIRGLLRLALARRMAVATAQG